MRRPDGIDGSEWVPPVDILEDNKEYLFKTDLPEMKESEVKVLVEKNVLFIAGKRNLESQEDGKKSLRIERPHGCFVRRFALPDDASRAEIKARFADGVLQVRVRKVTPHQIEKTHPQPMTVKVA
jgi:HSP20 family protein